MIVDMGRYTKKELIVSDVIVQISNILGRPSKGGWGYKNVEIEPLVNYLTDTITMKKIFMIP